MCLHAFQLWQRKFIYFWNTCSIFFFFTVYGLNLKFINILISSFHLCYIIVFFYFYQGLSGKRCLNWYFNDATHNCMYILLVCSNMHFFFFYHIFLIFILHFILTLFTNFVVQLLCLHSTPCFENNIELFEINSLA